MDKIDRTAVVRHVNALADMAITEKKKVVFVTPNIFDEYAHSFPAPCWSRIYVRKDLEARGLRHMLVSDIVLVPIEGGIKAAEALMELING